MGVTLDFPILIPTRQFAGHRPLSRSFRTRLAISSAPSLLKPCRQSDTIFVKPSRESDWIWKVYTEDRFRFRRRLKNTERSQGKVDTGSAAQR